MLKTRLIYIFMMLVNIAVFIFTNTRIPLITTATMLAAPVISYILLRIAAAAIKIECVIPDSAREGDVVKAKIITSGAVFYPGVFTAKKNVKSVMFGFDKETAVLHDLGGKVHEIDISFKSLCCGMHEVSVYDIKLYDALLLFGCSKKVTFRKNLIIYPQTVQVNIMRRDLSSVESDGIIYDKNRRGNDKSEIFELRDYVPGDDVKSIHWKLSSKLDKPVVREFSRPNNYKTMILCDLSMMLGGREIACKSISDGIALCGAISIDMTKKGIGHSICMLGKNVCEIEEINGFNDMIRLRNAIMTVKLEKKEFNTAFVFSSMPETAGVSKLIYITKEFDMSSISNLTAHADVTVITENDDRVGAYNYGKDNELEIISLSRHEFYSVLHNIAI